MTVLRGEGILLLMDTNVVFTLVSRLLDRRLIQVD